MKGNGDTFWERHPTLRKGLKVGSAIAFPLTILASGFAYALEKNPNDNHYDNNTHTYSVPMIEPTPEVYELEEQILQEASDKNNSNAMGDSPLYNTASTTANTIDKEDYQFAELGGVLRTLKTEKEKRETIEKFIEKNKFNPNMFFYETTVGEMREYNLVSPDLYKSKNFMKFLNDKNSRVDIDGYTAWILTDKDFSSVVVLTFCKDKLAEYQSWRYNRSEEDDKLVEAYRNFFDEIGYLKQKGIKVGNIVYDFEPLAFHDLVTLGTMAGEYLKKSEYKKVFSILNALEKETNSKDSPYSMYTFPNGNGKAFCTLEKGSPLGEGVAVLVLYDEKGNIKEIQLIKNNNIVQVIKKKIGGA